MKILVPSIAVILALCTLSFSQQQIRPIDSPAVHKIGGMDKVKAQREAYKTVDGEQLNFDLYRPIRIKQKRGVVVFANWKRKAMTEWVFMQSWARIVAASGLNAVVYQSAAKPDEDIVDVVDHLRKNAVKLGIDETRIGIFTMSGNTDVALPYFARADREYVRCAVIYYGFIIDNPPVRKDLPILIVRAGLEANPDTNKRLDGYAKLLLDHNAPLTFINYPEGHHSFDLVDATKRSKEIITETLDFLIKHLRTASN